MAYPFTRNVGVAVSAAAPALSLSASAALAGEITGNGRVLKVTDSKWGTGLHGRSECAFSGQEDLHYLDAKGKPLAVITKGVPGHAQSWGQIPKAVRDLLPAFFHPGISCNPVK